MASKEYDVIIVGAGPTGIFTALELINKESDLKVVILEKGNNLKDRECPMNVKNTNCVKCKSCSIVSGWGGAGAFSDGKLSLSPDIGGHLDEYIGKENLSELIKYADKLYLKFGAPDRIFGVDSDKVQDIKEKAVKANLKFIPARLRHLGTGYSKTVLQAMQDFIAEKGVDIRFGVNVKELLVEDATIKGVKTKEGEIIYGDYVVTAPGRENAEWLTLEAERLGIETTINPVDIGVRVECPAVITKELTDNIYESKLIYQTPTFDDKVRTFCMSPYGQVVNENNQGLITVNGHSHAEIKTENTNFALLVSKTFTEPFHEPITYGKNIAKLANLLGGGVLVQRLGDLLDGHRSTPERIARGIVEPTLKEATPGDLSLVLPYRHLKDIIEMIEVLDNLAPGLYSRDTLLYGVEVKFYSSRLEVNDEMETRINNLYAGGDGAGITRGLMQASVSGILIARSILNKV
ncbi:NAD(P)/FAD-dependent oxidoreductase [Halothermothrix orenii]|uniref:FAD dependent oxidoreductase n=1 Tax=Halothermothrix orenii (strain H 168 / OCM 544 / DSM 9562) TaxID=373903 RepID=B8D107_HALOH|nr:NAD(P)/FAD-dependent oxidoreductase [Halothermothrix orenii]ACL68976.1 FAD dependent oxidoreductase [Halothermothrix orenii H 168]